jgi:hypothetical protein
VPQLAVQCPAEHACPAPQTVPHAPQLALSLCVSMHDFPHSVVPVAQLVEHAPFEHTCPPVQAVPHAPQFDGSYCVLVQLPEHCVCEPGHWLASEPPSVGFSPPPEQPEMGMATMAATKAATPRAFFMWGRKVPTLEAPLAQAPLLRHFVVPKQRG